MNASGAGDAPKAGHTGQGKAATDSNKVLANSLSRVPGLKRRASGCVVSWHRHAARTDEREPHTRSLHLWRPAVPETQHKTSACAPTSSPLHIWHCAQLGRQRSPNSGHPIARRIARQQLPGRQLRWQQRHGVQRRSEHAILLHKPGT